MKSTLCAREVVMGLMCLTLTLALNLTPTLTLRRAYTHRTMCEGFRLASVETSINCG